MEARQPSWFFRQPRYFHAATSTPFVMAMAVLLFLLAPRMDQQIHGILLPLRVFALATLLLPLYCFWHTPSAKLSTQRNLILAFDGLVAASFIGAVLFGLPVLLWLGAILLGLPVVIALKRGEFVWR
jgi:hypothetical protein